MSIDINWSYCSPLSAIMWSAGLMTWQTPRHKVPIAAYTESMGTCFIHSGHDISHVELGRLQALWTWPGIATHSRKHRGLDTKRGNRDLLSWEDLWYVFCLVISLEYSVLCHSQFKQPIRFQGLISIYEGMYEWFLVIGRCIKHF